MTEGKINYWNIKIFDKKKNELLITIDVVGATKEKMENDTFYQERAIKNSGNDLKTEKWSDMSKFRFVAILLKVME